MGPTIAQQLGPDPSHGPFATVLRAADVMPAVITSSCDIYTRLWRVYEMFFVIQLGVTVKLRSRTETSH